MNRVADSLRRNLPGALLVMQVHDELIVECDISDSEKAASILKCEMESAITPSVPLIADVHTGKDWRSASKICLYLGITGGIGSGKSTVSSILRERGLTVLDADEISRQVTSAGGRALPLISETFGPRAQTRTDL